MSDTGNNDSFADHPKSIAEVKAARSENAKDWTPRDALIDMLRRIDSGECPCEAIFIAYQEAGSTAARFLCSSPHPSTTYGMTMRALMNSTEKD